MVFAAHGIEIKCVLDVLAHEDHHIFLALQTSQMRWSAIGCLVITETRRPHKVFEIALSIKGDKEILAPSFMKINKSNQNQREYEFVR